MSTTTQAQTQPQNLGLHSGVQARLSWRPLGIRAVESLAAGIAPFAGPLVHHPLSLSAWSEPFVRRVGPWSGWLPMPLEFQAQALLQSSAYATRSVKARTEATEKAAPLAVQRTAASSPRAARPSRAEPALSRPAMRLAMLGPLNPATTPQLRRENAPVFAPRIAFSVSPNPRQEVRGGFPIQQLPSAALSEAARAKTEPASSPIAVRRDDFSRPISATAAAKAATTNTSPGAIEKLIERTVLPVSLPGLQLRLVPSEQQPSVRRDSPSSDEGRQPRAENPPAPAPPPMPSIDINAVADKVYQTLMRRQQLERERKGLY